jgi:hypothetical protein
VADEMYAAVVPMLAATNGALAKELMNVKVNAKGGMGAEGPGEHDDLVITVALACWRAKRGWNDRGGGGFIWAVCKWPLINVNWR